jgi:hypothetical protein
MSEADTVGQVDRKIVHAMVAESVQKVEFWANTRLPDGQTLIEPLNSFSKDISKTDLLGKSVQNAEKFLASEAKKAVLGLVFSGSTPAWVVFFVSVVGGLIGRAVNIGRVTGDVTAPAIFGFITLIGSAGAVFLRTRIVAALPRLGASATEFGRDTHQKFWGFASSVGNCAEMMFKNSVSPGLSLVGYPRIGDSIILKRLRFIAKFTVVTIYLFVLGGFLFFVSGFLEAIATYKSGSIGY